MVIRERLLYFTPFHTSLKLPNLTTQEETLQPLVTHALFQGSIGYLSILPMAEVRDFHCSSHVDKNLGKKTLPSERLVIQKPSHRGDQNKRIPSWMSKHPMFGSILQKLHDDHRFSSDPFCALSEFKIPLHKAKKMTKRELSRQTPDCIGAKLLITSTAMRAYRDRHLGTLTRCCEAWKPIEGCFDTLSFECIDFQRLSHIFASLTRENLARSETEVSTLPSHKQKKRHCYGSM